MPAWRWPALAAAMVASVIAGAARADPIALADIRVIDRDTIVARGLTTRLVGFDAPELGSHARCGIERMLAARAWSRLHQLVASAQQIDLKPVACSCRPGTEGTPACNYGRAAPYCASTARTSARCSLPKGWRTLSTAGATPAHGASRGARSRAPTGTDRASRLDHPAKRGFSSGDCSLRGRIPCRTIGHAS